MFSPRPLFFPDSPYLEAVPPVHVDDQIDRDRRAAETRRPTDSPCDIDHRIVLPNGSDFIIHLQAEGVREEETDELTVIGTAQDITERKQAGTGDPSTGLLRQPDRPGQPGVVQRSFV